MAEELEKCYPWVSALAHGIIKHFNMYERERGKYN